MKTPRRLVPGLEEDLACLRGMPRAMRLKTQKLRGGQLREHLLATRFEKRRSHVNSPPVSLVRLRHDVVLMASDSLASGS
jgi:hypothetical protein